MKRPKKRLNNGSTLPKHNTTFNSLSQTQQLSQINLSDAFSKNPNSKPLSSRNLPISVIHNTPYQNLKQKILREL